MFCQSCPAFCDSGQGITHSGGIFLHLGDHIFPGVAGCIRSLPQPVSEAIQLFLPTAGQCGDTGAVSGEGRADFLQGIHQFRAFYVSLSGLLQLFLILLQLGGQSGNFADIIVILLEPQAHPGVFQGLLTFFQTGQGMAQLHDFLIAHLGGAVHLHQFVSGICHSIGGLLGLSSLDLQICFQPGNFAVIGLHAGGNLLVLPAQRVHALLLAVQVQLYEGDFGLGLQPCALGELLVVRDFLQLQQFFFEGLGLCGFLLESGALHLRGGQGLPAFFLQILQELFRASDLFFQAAGDFLQALCESVSIDLRINSDDAVIAKSQAVSPPF